VGVLPVLYNLGYWLLVRKHPISPIAAAADYWKRICSSPDDDDPRKRVREEEAKS
jgi:hypothetical protein